MLYDYKCDKCENIIELMQQYTQVGDFPCSCGGMNKRYFGNQKMQIVGLENFNKEFFDVSTGRYYPVSKREKIGKERGELWLGNDEINKECKKNKEENLKKIDNEFKVKTEKEIRKILN